MMNARTKRGAEQLSLYRQEIMGIAAILILVGHAQDFVSSWSSQLAKLIGYGSVGINMFAFLSGIGLHFSLDKNSSVVHFYQRRIQRVFVPYLVITALMTIPTIFSNSGGIGQYLWDISGLSFWTQHRGAWYIAWLLPVCIVYPFIWKTENWNKRNCYASVLVILMSTVLTVIGESNTLLHGFRSVFSVTISFFLGNIYATHVKQNKKTLPLLLLCFIPTPFYILGIVRNDVFYVWTFALFGVGLCALCGVVLSVVNQVEGVKWVLKQMGKISLESYLTNIYLITCVRLLFKENIETGFGLAIYGAIVLIGLSLSVYFHSMFEKISHHVI